MRPVPISSAGAITAICLLWLRRVDWFIVGRDTKCWRLVSVVRSGCNGEMTLSPLITTHFILFILWLHSTLGLFVASRDGKWSMLRSEWFEILGRLSLSLSCPMLRRTCLEKGEIHCAILVGVAGTLFLNSVAGIQILKHASSNFLNMSCSILEHCFSLPWLYLQVPRCKW